MPQNRKIPQAKIDEVENIKALVNKYAVVGVARVEKVPASALHSLRNALRGDVIIKMAKKRLVKIAFDGVNKPKLPELVKEFSGSSVLLLTNMNPIKLAQFLESKAVKGPCKPGDIAPDDIMVKAGDTKLAPGPIISELNQNLKLPTLIKDGTVHIRNDTVTHKKGEVINGKQAQLLTRLGLEPMTIKLDFYSAWENGELIPSAVLHVDLAKIDTEIRLAVSQAMNLALNIELVTPQTVNMLVMKAIRSANQLAMSIPIFIPELLPQYISKAVCEMNAISATVFGTSSGSSVKAPAAGKGSKKESEAPKEPEKPKEPEDSGLGSLFG